MPAVFDENIMPTQSSKSKTASLFLAIEERDAPAVMDILTAGTSPDVIGRDRLSALFAATINDDYATMLALLDAGADPNLGGARCKIVNDYATPLNYACAKRLRSAVRLLLDRGANPAITSSNGRSAAHHLGWATPANNDYTPSYLRHVERTFAQMIDAGLPMTAVDENGIALVHAALLARAPLPTFEMLIDRGADPLQARQGGWQLAHLATNFRRTDVLRLLARRGVAIDAIDEQGRTPLFCAGEETLKTLLELGANIDHQDVAGNTVLHEQVSTAQKTAKVSPLIRELFEAGARLDIRNNRGETAFDIAKRRKLEDHKAFLSASAARQAMRLVTKALTP